MARPSKKTIELRDKIKELNIFKRDNEIYTNFELKCEGSNKYYTPYLFCEDAGIREMVVSKKPQVKIEKICENSTTNKIIKLHKINKKLALYYLNLKTINITLFYPPEYKQRFNYHVDTLIDNDLVERAIGKDMEEYHMNGMYSLNDIGSHLTDEMRKQIVDEVNQTSKAFGYTYSPYRIKIKHERTFLSINHYTETPYTKTADVEIDFTKSKEEILAFIEQLKDDYDSGLLSIKTPEEILTDKTKDDFKCDLKSCVIYKDTRSPKPIHGRLADVLFIYDCMKVNEILGADVLTKDFITDEITQYWKDIKNISTEKFYSFDEYYAIAKEYIDNERYKDYLSGIKTPL